MPKTLFQFIWRHSSREQLILLGLTIASFPLLYMTLELPKTIVNQAVDRDAWAEGPPEGLAQSLALDQVSFLAALCGVFLGFVVLGGVLKMYINTRKGVLAERLLRRLRYTMISRILRFPLPYFRRTSQGELVSVVTAEAEPLGGLMGDAIAQPVFLGGQMLTILIFLFVQSPWLGLASIALIPLQAWLIPMLQRRVNALNKERVQHVRKLSERIGETVNGVEDLRAHNGVSYVLGDFSRRLGALFDIRTKIYRAKFFMKFLNNFINQITPFFFFLIGGYLVIEEQLTIGALVAALASYKDLTSPWRELLVYYNQTQDMSLRYHTILERFDPPGLLGEALFEGRPESAPRLNGPVRVENVTVLDVDGAPVLQDVSFEIPPGSAVGMRIPDPDARRAMAQVLARTIMPNAGRVMIGPHDLAELHQQAVAQRVGHAGGDAQLFNAPVIDNVAMALLEPPEQIDVSDPEMTAAQRREVQEAIAAGNRPYLGDLSAGDPTVSWTRSDGELQNWWLEIIEAMGADAYLFESNLNQQIDPAAHPRIAAQVAELRGEIATRLQEAGVAGAVDSFDRDAFNPSLTVVENLLFAVARPALARAEGAAAMAGDPRLREALRAAGVETMLFRLAEDLLAIVVETFKSVGGRKPILERVAGLDDAEFGRLKALREKLSRPGAVTLNEEESALLLALPFRVGARRLGAPVARELRRRILEARRRHGARLAAELSDYFHPITPDAYIPGLSILENAINGRLNDLALGQQDIVRRTAAEALAEAGLKGSIALLIAEQEAGVAGVNIGAVARERIAVSRAAIRRPDILVFERALASHEPDARQAARMRIRELLPKATIFHIEENFMRPELYDLIIEIRDARVVDPAADLADGAAGETTRDARAAASRRRDNRSAVGDMDVKIRALSRAPLFRGLGREQLRLLAYAARWVTAKRGRKIFRSGDPAHSAYLLIEGAAVLRWPDDGPQDEPITTVRPGRLIGDLSVIADTPRHFDLVATEDVLALKIGREEIVALIENDARLASSLLRMVAGHLSETAFEQQEMREAVKLLAAQVSAQDAAAPEGAPLGATGGAATDRSAEEAGAMTPRPRRGSRRGEARRH